MLSELFKLRYILAVELILLIVFVFFDLIPFLIILSLLILCVVVYLAFDSPIIAVHILIFSILIDSLVPLKNNSSGPSLLIVEFVFCLLFMFALIKFLLNSDEKSLITNQTLLWIPFLVWSLSIGLLIGVDKLRILAYWKNYLAGFFAFYLAFNTIKNKFHLKSIILGVIIWGGLLALLEIWVLLKLGGFTTGIVGLFLKKNLLTLGWGRSNYLAAFFVIIIPFTVGYLLYAKSRRIKIFLIVVLVMMSFGMILTLSRGGILSLLVAFVFLLSRVLKKRTFIPFLVVILTITIVLLLNPLTYVLIDRISSLETSGSVYSRINFYKDVWKTFLKYPITGVGLGNLSYYATFILPKYESPSAHNIVLGALGETGIFGAAFYFGLLYFSFKNVYSSFKKETEETLRIFKWCCVSSMIGGLVNTLVEPTLDGLQFSIMFWTLTGVYLKLNILNSCNTE